MPEIKEYDITYIAKEFLQKNGWAILAFNPPGSQGTFTIPNPLKDAKYRGQTGSLSPDIVALKSSKKENIFLIVESKPIFNKNDVKKMIKMFKNPLRKEIFLRIIEKQALANNVKLNLKVKNTFVFAKAHAGKKHIMKNIKTIHVGLIDQSWNKKIVDPTECIYDKFSVGGF